MGRGGGRAPILRRSRMVADHAVPCAGWPFLKRPDPAPAAAATSARPGRGGRANRRSGFQPDSSPESVPRGGVGQDARPTRLASDDGRTATSARPGRGGTRTVGRASSPTRPPNHCRGGGVGQDARPTRLASDDGRAASSAVPGGEEVVRAPAPIRAGTRRNASERACPPPHRPDAQSDAEAEEGG
jgi:hypothetical protein